MVFEDELAAAVAQIERLALAPRFTEGGEAAAKLDTIKQSAMGQIQASARKVADASDPAVRATLVQTQLRRLWQIVGQAIERTQRLNLEPFDIKGDTVPGTAVLQDLVIEVRDAVIPPEAATLKVELDAALNVVKAVMTERAESARFWNWGSFRKTEQGQHEYLSQLKGIAGVGLLTTEPSRVAFARLDLARLRNVFVLREAGRVKNTYVARLATRSAVVAILFFCLYCAAKGHVIGRLEAAKEWDGVVYDLRNFFLLAAGTAIGTWLSFSLRRQELTFDDLAVLEPDRLSPTFRVIYTIGLAGVIGLLLFCGAVVAGVGEVKGLEAMRMNGSSALLLGMLSGIAERALGTAVTRSGASFAAGIGGAEAARVKV